MSLKNSSTTALDNRLGSFNTYPCRSFSRRSRTLAVILLFLLTLVIPFKTFGQGVLLNGVKQTGTLAVNTTDSYTFAVNSGDNILLRMGADSFNPQIDLYDATDTLVKSASISTSGGRDAELVMQAPSGGTFTAKVSSHFNGGKGAYILTLAQSPEAFQVASGDQGGALNNGFQHSGTIDIGDLDMWSFNANAGDSIIVRMGATGFNPQIRLYGPNGSLAGSAFIGTSGGRDAELSVQATNSGVYTVVAGSYYPNGTGPYILTLAQSPETFQVASGDQGGALNNGFQHSGTIDIGDLDMWSFNANAGDSVIVRIGATGFNPQIRLYGPNGSLAGSAFIGTSGGRDAELSVQATNSGVYTVVAGSYYPNGTGPYILTLAQSPETFQVASGDQGGTLTNGFQHSGTIDIGDLDLWSFNANAGDSVIVRIGATGFNPQIRLYGPNGALVDSAFIGTSGGRDAELSVQATNSGVYTVVAGSYYPNGTGPYILTLAQSPETFQVASGDQGGTLTNGFQHSGTVDVGDLDLWSFNANAGESIILRMGATGFNPQIRLFGPNGSLVDSAFIGTSGGRDAELSIQATNSGVYTVVVGSYYSSAGGAYTLTLAHPPEVVVTALGDEGGPMANGFTYQGTNSVGDLDVWSFYGTAGDSNIFRIGTTGFNPWLRLYDPSGALVKEVFNGASGNRTNQLTYVVTNSGPYTLVSAAYYSGQSGPYNLKQSRWAPDLVVPDTVTIDEGEILDVSIFSQDPDEAGKVLLFNRIDAPAGVNFGLAGATNAPISWVTSEATGPSTNVITASVSDTVNGKTFVRTNSFTVIVREINTPPRLTVPSNQTINELEPLVNISTSAVDDDLPKNPLTFSLLSKPDGMTIDPVSGAISWVPTEAQGPSTNQITVVVTDDSPYAANETHLSATNSFIIVVQEINVRPNLIVPQDQVINELQPLVSVGAGATDDDLPKNPLTFSLLSKPDGMTIDQVSGAISWVPTEAQGPSTNIVSVVVTDSNPLAINAQQMGITNSFVVVVREVNTPPTLPVQTNFVVEELKTLTVTNVASDMDIPANTLTYVLAAAPTNAIISAEGIISWTPTEAQGPGTNIFTTIVTDNGIPSLSATNTFSVVVSEVNTPPALPAQGNFEIDELNLLTVTNTATDTDIPLNSLTYTLLAAPTNASISTNGVISWVPTESQGPNTNVFITIVEDNGNPSYRATNTFTVVVNEVNLPPEIQPIGNRTLHYATALSIQAIALDTDIPTNTLTFSLINPPEGMTIDPASGVITWTPTKAESGVNSVTVRVDDDGSPSQSATNTFQITVTGDESRLAIQRLSSDLIQITVTGDTGFDYELQKSADLTFWEKVVEFKLSGSAYNYIEPDTATTPLRFYRLKLVQ